MSDANSEFDEENPEIGELIDAFEELDSSLKSKKQKKLLKNIKKKAVKASKPRIFGVEIKGFGKHDMVQAFMGSLIIGIPVIIEEGTLEIGEFIAQHPLFLLGTLLFGVIISIGIIYKSNIQDVKVIDPLLGFIPQRLVGVLGIAFLTSVTLMTIWGRVDWASEPFIAFCQCSFTFVIMAVGASLGDILPGD